MSERFEQPDGRVHAVIVACQRADGRWLFIRRSQHVRAPGKVGFPGGGLESGETQQQAVLREMREELDAQVSPLQQVWRFDFPNALMTLFAWRATLLNEQLVPNPAEVAEILWLTREEALAHPDRTDQLPSVMAALVPT